VLPKIADVVVIGGGVIQLRFSRFAEGDLAREHNVV